MDKPKRASPILVIFLTLTLLCVVFVCGTLLLVRQGILQAEGVFKPLVDGANIVATQVSQALNPNPTIVPKTETIIHSMRSLARLETMQYSVEKVITAETNQGWFAAWLGDKLLFVAHGTVIAGVDMAKLEPDDMWIEGGVLYMRLPPSEIFLVTLDNDKSYVYDRGTGLFTHGDPNLETSARQTAEEEILKAAIEDGILEHARENAENYLSRLGRSLGYADVIFPEP